MLIAFGNLRQDKEEQSNEDHNKSRKPGKLFVTVQEGAGFRDATAGSIGFNENDHGRGGQTQHPRKDQHAKPGHGHPGVALRVRQGLD